MKTLDLNLLAFDKLIQDSLSNLLGCQIYSVQSWARLLALIGEIKGDGLDRVRDLHLYVSCKVFHGGFVSFVTDYFVKTLDDLADGLKLFGIVFVFGVEMLHMIGKDLEKIFELYFGWDLVDRTQH